MRWIYLLRDPRTYVVRYVGCARAPDERLQRHVAEAVSGRDRGPRAAWLRRLIARGLQPILCAAEHLGARVDHALRERQWIEHLIAEGEPLLNVQSGGVRRRRKAKHLPEGERARRAMVVGAGVRRAVAEYGDRSSDLPQRSDGHRGEVCPQHGWQGAQPCPCSTPGEDVPSPQLNRFGHFQDALGRWRTPRGAKPRGRVPVKRPLR